MVMQNINGDNKDVQQNEFSNVLMKNILKNSEINMQESKSLAIPKRPKWKEGIQAKEFERMEREAFLNWRRQLAEEEEKHMELAITPFEKNIEIWRQLWLVVEKSQVLIQIVDGRNPLFFRSLDLENYIIENNSEKEIILLVNKADLLSEEIRSHWADYFNEKGIKYIFFSALVEGDKLEKAEEEEKLRVESSNIKDEIEKNNNKEKNKKIELEDDSDDDEITIKLNNQFMQLKVDHDDENLNEEKIENIKIGTNRKIEELEEKQKILKEIQKEKNEKNLINIEEEQKIANEDKKEIKQNEKKSLSNMTIEELEELHKKNSKTKILNREELINFIKIVTKNKKKNTNIDHFFIGFIGYPNVGKSSVINVLMKKKG